MTKYTENDISWIITEPLSKAKIYIHTNTGDDNFIPVPKNILDTTKPIKSGDRVALLWDRGEPVYFANVRGSTTKSILTAVEKGMKEHIPVTYENTKIVYKIIGNFLRKPMRQELVKKYESGKITPADLAGDHVFFEGNISRKNHIWAFGLGS